MGPINIYYTSILYIYIHSEQWESVVWHARSSQKKREEKNDERIDLNKSHAFMHEQSILSTLCIYAMYDNVLLRTEGEPQKEKRKKRSTWAHWCKNTLVFFFAYSTTSHKTEIRKYSTHTIHKRRSQAVCLMPCACRFALKAWWCQNSRFNFHIKFFHHFFTSSHFKFMSTLYASAPWTNMHIWRSAHEGLIAYIHCLVLVLPRRTASVARKKKLCKIVEFTSADDDSTATILSLPVWARTVWMLSQNLQFKCDFDFYCSFFFVDFHSLRRCRFVAPAAISLTWRSVSEVTNNFFLSFSLLFCSRPMKKFEEDKKSIVGKNQ